MISILPIQPDILQMMAEDTGLTAEGPVWGYFAAEGTKMLGYVVVERAEPVRIIALHKQKNQNTTKKQKPPGSGQPGGPFCGEMPRKYRRNLKKPLAFFQWECYHNKVPSNSM